MATTTNPLDALLYIRDGNPAARWNFPDAVGTPRSAPGGIGNAVNLTYSFPTSAPTYSGSDGRGFQTFNAVQRSAVRAILASIAEVANVRFTEVTGVGQLTYAMSSQSNGQAGYAYVPSYGYQYTGSTITATTENQSAGDVWMNRDAGWRADAWLPNQDGYASLLHETGHALGFKHPFESSASGYTLDPALDDESHTVMSYDLAPRATLLTVTGSPLSYSWQETYLHPATLMPLDIAALQYLYGANTATRAGNDVYRWAPNAEILESIWDGGGTDTIDCSNQGLSCVIDLRPGSYSSIARRQTDAERRAGLDLPSWYTEPLPDDIYDGSHNLAIAAGVTIENAKGGSGNDQLIGNDAANQLLGGAGADQLTGGRGNDLLDGGSGADRMTGGDGSDTYYVDNLADRVVETNANPATGGTDRVYSRLTSYTLEANIELGRILSTGTASLTGNALNNTLYAGVGNNALNGGAGTDTLSYAYGVTGTLGVTVSLASSAPQSTGGSGTDTLAQIENLVGSPGDDNLTGSSGNNRLDGAGGSDRMAGGGGNDTYSVRETGDRVVEGANAGTDTVESDLSSYTLGSNVENGRVLASGAASLTGNSLNNQLTGNAYANTLRGAGGADTLTGGAGADRFRYLSPAEGGDRITDFASRSDKIEVVSPNFAGLPLGNLAAERLRSAGSTPSGNAAVFLYNGSTGALAFDRDGGGTALPVLLATLTGPKTLIASDIQIVAA